MALENEGFLNMIRRELRDGSHINPEGRIYAGLGTSHLHTVKALKAELAESGFEETTVHGVMGGAWLAHDIDGLWENEKSREILMETVRMLDGHDEIIGLSGHLLAISRLTERG